MNEKTTIDQLNQRLANQVASIDRINDTLIDNFIIDKYQTAHLTLLTGTYSRDFYLATILNMGQIVQYLNATIDTLNNKAYLVNQDTGEALVEFYGRPVPRITIKDFFSDTQDFVQRIDDKLSDCVLVVSQFYSMSKTNK